VREDRTAYQTVAPDQRQEPENAVAEDAPQKSDDPPRKGWWQKRFGNG
jgi:hypothetical protein